MKIIDTARRARKSLAHAKSRTLLTSLAIGVGAFTITLSLAAGVGGKDYASMIVHSNTDPKEVTVSPKSQQEQRGPKKYHENKSSTSNSGFSSFMDMLNDDDIAKIKSVKHVVSVQPYLMVSPEYITRPGQDKYELSSLSIYDPAISQSYSAGHIDGKLQDGMVIISQDYRKALGFKSDKDAIGETVDIAVYNSKDRLQNKQPKEFKYKIAAVKGSSTIIAMSSGDVIANYNTVKEVDSYIHEGSSQGNAYMLATTKVDDVKNVDKVKQAMKDKGYDAQTAQDVMEFIFQFINVLQGILIGFGALAVLTAIFGIVNTQYISVLERTQQIGLMKALGMRRRDVGRLFKLEAAWIGFLGGALGSGLAFIAGVIANPHINDFLHLDKGVDLLLFKWWIFVVVIGGLMIISVASGILPSRKASKLDPIEALRTE